MSNNMLDILKNFDDAATGNKPAAGSQDSSDMKKILESFYNVKPKETIKEAVSVTADSPDELASLVKLMGHGDQCVINTQLMITIRLYFVVMFVMMDVYCMAFAMMGS